MTLTRLRSLMLEMCVALDAGHLAEHIPTWGENSEDGVGQIVGFARRFCDVFGDRFFPGDETTESLREHARILAQLARCIRTASRWLDEQAEKEEADHAEARKAHAQMVQRDRARRKR